MRDCDIHDGDLLVVDRLAEATHNRVVIAALDGDLLVKRLARQACEYLARPVKKYGQGIIKKEEFL